MITIALAPLTSTFLLSIRLGTAILFAPIEALRCLPTHVRLLMIFVLSLLMSPQTQLPSIPEDSLSLAMSALAEAANGLIILVSLYAVFTSFQIAGQWIDSQIGLNSTVFNPSDHSHDSLSSRLLQMLAVLFFFAADGQAVALSGFAKVFTGIPLGTSALTQGFYPLMKQCSLMFSTSLIIASPVVFSLFIVDVLSAILTRTMPQISAYFLILPIKIGVGIFLLSLSIYGLNPLMNQRLHDCFLVLESLWS